MTNYEGPELDFKSASFMIQAHPQRGQVSLCIRDYVIHKKLPTGEYNRMPRVESFTFHVDRNGAKLTIVQNEHEPTGMDL
jgi:hypothetical protein